MSFRTAFLFVLAVLAFGPFVVSAVNDDRQWALVIDPGPAETVAQDPVPALTVEMLLDDFPTDMVHAPTVVEAANGDLLVAWYGGRAEGSRDVGVYISRRPSGAGEWTSPTRVVDRHVAEAAAGVHVRSIGNPVLARDPEDRIWLFFVTTFGGWSTAAIDYLRSADDGRTWSVPVRLVTAPGWNISTLVRNPPIFYRDGRMGLPVYHEFLRKLSELLILTPEGKVADKVRISADRQAIQPSVIALDAHNAIALMRPIEPPFRVLMARTEDGGQTWSDVTVTDLLNPGAAAMGLRTVDGALVFAYNDHDRWRANMALALSPDEGATWPAVRHVDEMPDPWIPPRPKRRFTVAYPAIVRTSDGGFHLFYAYARAAIKHLAFNAAWLDAQLRP